MSAASTPSRKRDSELCARFTGLVDLVETDQAEVGFLTFHMDEKEPQVKREARLPRGKVEPPDKVAIPFPLARASAVIEFIRKDTDAALFTAASEYLHSVSDLPSKGLYAVLSLWVAHTYVQDACEYSPVLYLHAVSDRGKTRTAGAILRLSYRGIIEESLREANVIRFAHAFAGSLFLDVFDFWGEVTQEGSRDLFLKRFEKGAKVSRVNRPDAGAFRDTDYYEVFGPTIVATNVAAPQTFYSRCLPIPIRLKTRDVRKPDAGEEQRLRERFLAFRARHLYDTLPLVESCGDGRFADIAHPLLQTARWMGPECEREVRGALADLRDSYRQEKAATFEATVLQAIRALRGQFEDTSKGPMLLATTLTEHLNESLSERFKVKVSKVRNALKALGFNVGRHPRANQQAVVWDEARLIATEQDYGLTPTPPPTPGETPQTPQTPEVLPDQRFAAGDSTGDHRSFPEEATPPLLEIPEIAEKPPQTPVLISLNDKATGVPGVYGVYPGAGGGTAKQGMSELPPKPGEDPDYDTRIEREGMMNEMQLEAGRGC